MKLNRDCEVDKSNLNVLLKLLKYIYSVYFDILYFKWISILYEIFGLKFLKLCNCEVLVDYVLYF